MKNYEVIGEFVDLRTGKRIFPALAGNDAVTFTPHDDDQADRLIAARCLREPKAGSRGEAQGKGKASNGDDWIDLGTKTVEQLWAMAKGEKIDLGHATRKADIIATIRAAREG